MDPDVTSNWIILVSFSSDVEKALVIAAHAVMTVLFGAYQNHSYLECRPSHLPVNPQLRGLNEFGPLGQDGLVGYNSLRHGADQKETALIFERAVLAGRLSGGRVQQERMGRLKTGGPIHVNVLKSAGAVKRFFITPMIKSDSCYIDISIPLIHGLAYGLEISRSVNVLFDMQPGMDHLRPYAIRAKSHSLARQLGILITGIRIRGPHKGGEFKLWVQCNRREAVTKADKLAHTLLSLLPINHDSLNTANEGTELHAAPIVRACLEILRQLYEKVRRAEIRAAADIRVCFYTNSVESIASIITSALSPTVAMLMNSAIPVTAAREVL